MKVALGVAFDQVVSGLTERAIGSTVTRFAEKLQNFAPSLSEHEAKLLAGDALAAGTLVVSYALGVKVAKWVKGYKDSKSPGVGAPTAGAGARFADQSKLTNHYNRHGADFGATSKLQYQQLADDFLTGPRGPNTLEITRSNGDIVRYDPSTDAFGIVSSGGDIRTFYVPDPAVHGYPTNLDYFNAQRR